MTCDPLAADPGCASGSVCQAGRCVQGPVPPPVCLAAIQRYAVSAAFAYTVTGSESGYLHRQIVDPATGACVADPTAGPLQVGRFHLEEPACGEDEAITTVAPNPCRLTLEEPVVQDDAPATRASEGVRFRSRGISFDFADVVLPLPEVPGATYTPVPAGYKFLLRIASGFTPLGVILDAAFPDRIVPAPDGSLWIVDSGDVRSSGLRGQLIRFTNGTSAIQARLQ